MTEQEQNSQYRSPLAWLAASLFLALLYPLLGMLWHHRYPVFSAEVLLICAGAGVLALLLGAAMRGLNPRIAGLVFSTLLLFVFTIHFNLFFAGMAAVFAGALALSLLMGSKFPGFLATVLLVLVVAAFLDSRLQPATSLQPAPETEAGGEGPLIHVLMDGFMSPSGLAGAGEKARVVAEQAVDFFAGNGFEVNTQSYSHYDRTLDSMTRMFNFTNDSQNLFKRNQALREPMEFPANRWFGIIGGMGYSLSVYQTEALDFCRTQALQNIRCNQFPNPNLPSIHEGVDSPVQRAGVLLQVLVNQSGLLTSLLHSHQLMGSWGVGVFDDRVVDTMLQDILRNPGGAYFAHWLVPHFPFVMTKDCEWDYGSEQVLRWPAQDGLVGNSEESRAERYQRILPQYRCALKQLDTLVSGLKKAGLYDNATLIVHGDHGTGAFLHSPYVSNIERLTGRDLREVYSALYAVKYPQGSFSLQQETRSLNVLLARTAMQLTGKSADELGIAVSEEDQPFVYLLNEEPLTAVLVDIYSDL